MDARKNFAFGTLAAGINNSATSCSVGSGEGARFPAVPFQAVIWNSTDYTHPGAAYHVSQAEIVTVTAISTDTLTIRRAQESTSAQNLNTGGKTYQIWAGPTSRTWSHVMPDHTKRRVSFAVVNTTSSLQVFGDDLSGSAGTNTYVAGTATEPPYVARASAASIGALSGHAWGSDKQYHPSRNIRFIARAKLSATTSVRFWVALTNQTLGNCVTQDSAGHVAGFRFSTPGGDTNFMCCTRDGTTQGVTDSGIAADTNVHLFEIEFVGTSEIRFYIDSQLVATRTANLPTALLGPVIGLEAQAASARTASAASIYIEQDL